MRGGEGSRARAGRPGHDGARDRTRAPREALNSGQQLIQHEWLEQVVDAGRDDGLSLVGSLSATGLTLDVGGSALPNLPKTDGFSAVE
jgi:hypothetical protein